MFGFGKRKKSVPPGEARSNHGQLMGQGHFYFHEVPLWILFIGCVTVGPALIVVDVATTSNFWNALMLHFAYGIDSGTKQGIQLISVALGSAFTIHFFIILFRLGRHYSDRHIQIESDALGIEKSTASSGGDFMLYLFSELQHKIPYMTLIIGISTTTFGLLTYLHTPFVLEFSLTAAAIDLNYIGAALIGGVIAASVFYLGPTLSLTAFHFMSQAKRERYLRTTVRAIAATQQPAALQSGQHGGRAVAQRAQSKMNVRGNTTASLSEIKELEELSGNPLKSRA